MREEGVWFTPEKLATGRNRLGAIFVAILGIPGVVFAAVVGGVLAAAAGTVVAVAVGGALWWYNRAFERTAALRFTDDSIQYRRGVWFQQQSDVPYRRITNVTASQGPIERSLDVGSIAVQTAGQSGQAGAELSVSGLSDYDELKEQLMTAVRTAEGQEATGRESSHWTSEPPTDRDVNQEILEEVRRIRERLE